MKLTSVFLACAAACGVLLGKADNAARAGTLFYFLGPWSVQEVKHGVVRQLQLNFTAGVDEWTLQSPVTLVGDSAAQVGSLSLESDSDGVVSLWATPGVFGQSGEATSTVDAEGMSELPQHSSKVAKEHIMDFMWTRVQVEVEADKAGSHLAAAASGPLVLDKAGSFQLQRVPVGTKHGVEGAAAHRSDVGDLFSLSISGGALQQQWLAVRAKDDSAGSFWTQYQWWIMGAIFIANLGLRSWARGRGRRDAQATPQPSMQQARAARRGKAKSS